jgi:transposase-like protein
MIPSPEQLKEWRKLAEDTMMISAVGEYTPQEFTTLLDEVDRLREVNAALLEAARIAAGELSAQRPLGHMSRAESNLRAAIKLAEGKE